MSDTGTQAPPRQSEFAGATAAATPEELRRAAAAANGNGGQALPPQPVISREQYEADLAAATARAAEAARAEVANGTAAIQARLDLIQAEREAEVAAKQAEVDAANAAAETERLDKMTLTQRLEHHTAETDARFRQLQEERDAEQALFAKEREFTAQSEYRTQALTANADQIMPQLRDLVAFGDKATVDQSIADVIARTQSVLTDVQQAQQQQWGMMPGVSPTMPASGPMENVPGETREFTAQQIAAMSPQEYQKHRSRLLQGASNYMRRMG